MSRDLITDTELALRSARQLQERIESDPYRPRFHFQPPGGWLNDPNGALYWRARYHLFYQYYPDAAYSVIEHRDGSQEHLRICWGHASSSDLIHWEHHPIALQPSLPGVDDRACFSGHVVDNDGVATMIYCGIPGGSCIATSSDYRLERWTKHPRVVIPRPRPGDPDHGRYGACDPCMWREGDRWYALCGFRSPRGGDTASLFRSHDTLHWEFVHDFYESRRDWTSARDDCAVPDFFPLGDTHVLLFMSHETGARYYLGDWRGETRSGVFLGVMLAAAALALVFLVAFLVARLSQRIDSGAAADAGAGVASATVGSPAGIRLLGLLLLALGVLVLGWSYLDPAGRAALVLRVLYPASIAVALVLLFDKATRSWTPKGRAEGFREWLLCDLVVIALILGFLNLEYFESRDTYRGFFWDLVHIVAFFFVFWLLDRTQSRGRFLVAVGYLALLPLLLLLWRWVHEVEAPAELSWWSTVWPTFFLGLAFFVLEIISLIALRGGRSHLVPAIKDAVFAGLFAVFLFAAIPAAA